MKNIIVRRLKDTDGNWKISGVQTEAYYAEIGKNMEQVKEAIPKCNTELCHWEIIEVDDNIADIIRFCVGEDEYKGLVTKRDLYRELKSIHETLDEIDSDICDITYSAESAINKCKELFEDEDW